MEVEIHNEYEFFEPWRELTKYDWPNTTRSTWSKEMQERWKEFNVFKPKGCSFPYNMLLRKQRQPVQEEKVMNNVSL